MCLAQDRPKRHYSCSFCAAVCGPGTGAADRHLIMDNFVEIARAGELGVGGIKGVLVDGRRIALCRTAAGYFAVDNVCPHRGGPLDQGDLVGSEIVCPWHLWGFDVVTGICGGNPTVSIVTHEVKVEDSRVLVRLSPVRETSSTLL